MGTEILIAISYILGVISGMLGLLAISLWATRKDQKNVIGPIIIENEGHNTDWV